MPAIFTCTHCKETALRNVRLKKDKPQKYCSRSDCQNARRNEWRRKKRSESVDYRARCAAQQKKWRQSYPADQYQKNYREFHPEYVARNKKMQRQRNAKRKALPPSSAIQEHALILHSGTDGSWLLWEMIGAKIVKRYALSACSNSDGAFALVGIEGAKIVKRYALSACDP